MEVSVAAPGGYEIGVIVFIVRAITVPVVLLTVIPFWKICAKAGFPGALSLVILVPFGNSILPFYIAFAEWPALKGRRE